ncbi:MAG: GTPase HflX [Clostridium sp.]|uniref:GTPase HflX n=1 Tax=Clostridium sp. TaxID=1506 RepID=UPI0029111089|nr:GTPase HflX [Clostridium sp.]MDU7338451.1 GTPase HflX [Clostridium sp.]
MELFENEIRPERALLVAVDTGDYDVQASMAELYELTRSAGADPIGSMVQKRPSPDKATCVGSGMADDIAEHCKQYEMDLLIFDCELSPTQIRNLEALTNVRVIDRTMLILDIFAARAKSKEGKLQVELAQLRYLLPRLSGKGISMSRLGGGIGTRGPGETKLETDRRHIRRKIENLKEQLDEVEKHREQINRRRQKDGIITVALVGYTNAGKSTLMNYLTQAGVLAKDQLFATLDPTARALKLPSGVTVMLIDTVGFVRRLPHHLINAFRSTLEQAALADLILNVCDASSPEAQTHLEVTRTLLSDLGCKDRPMIPVLNKCDLVPELDAVPMIGNAVRISAFTGAGMGELLETIERNLPVRTVLVEALLPFSESGLAARIRKDGVLQEEVYTENGLKIIARVGPELLQLLSDYLIEPDLE